MEALEHDESFYNCECPICGKKFHVKPYHLHRFKTNYCSKECQNEARKIYMRNEGNHQYGLKGRANATWKGGTKETCYGYLLVQQLGHPFSVGRSEYVFEHRLVAEKYLLTPENSVEINGKRYLSPDYVAHHKNGNKKDNRKENLEVMTLSEHQAMHAKKQNKRMQRDTSGRYTAKNTERGTHEV